MRSPSSGDGNDSSIVRVRKLRPDEPLPASNFRRSRLFSSLQKPSSSVKNDNDDVVSRGSTATSEKTSRTIVGNKTDEEKCELESKRLSRIWNRGKQSLRLPRRRQSYDVSAALAASGVVETRDSGVLASSSPHGCELSVKAKPRRLDSRPSDKASHRAAVVNGGVLQNFTFSAVEADESFVSSSTESFKFDPDESPSSDSGEGFDFFDDATTSDGDSLSSVNVDGDDEILGDRRNRCSESCVDVSQPSEEPLTDMKPGHCCTGDSGHPHHLRHHHHHHQQHQAYPLPRSYEVQHGRLRDRRNVVRDVYCMPQARDSGYEDGMCFPYKTASLARSNNFFSTPAPLHPPPPPPPTRPHRNHFYASMPARGYHCDDVNVNWRSDDHVRSIYADVSADEESEGAQMQSYDSQARQKLPVTRSLGRGGGVREKERTIVVPIDVDRPVPKARRSKTPAYSTSSKQFLLSPPENPIKRPGSAPIFASPTISMRNLTASPNNDTSLGDFDVVHARHQLTFRRKPTASTSPKSARRGNLDSRASRNVEIYTIIVTLVKRERLRPRRLGHGRWGSGSNNSNSPRSTPRSSPRNSRDYSSDFPAAAARGSEDHAGSSRGGHHDDTRYDRGRADACDADPRSAKSVMADEEKEKSSGSKFRFPPFFYFFSFFPQHTRWCGVISPVMRPAVGKCDKTAQ